MSAARLAELIGSAGRVVALTGAGISVPSGIPDFRSPAKGLWANVDPIEVAHIAAWRRDPDSFWSFYGQRFALLHDKRPNGAHLALAELERRHLLEAVVTQNIDRLHRLAGSERLIEVHGSIDWSACLRCGARVELERVLELLAEVDGAPPCDSCGAPLKPDVVLFGEMLRPEAIDAACELAQTADLMLCVGSSLEVHPVAGLPELTLRRGGSLALVTQGPTPYDARAAVKLEGDVEQELRALVAAIGPSAPPAE